MFLGVFDKKMNGPALILAASTFLSAVLGLVRDKLLAYQFGTGQELAIYAAAFRIPDLVYVFLISGGLAMVFLPLFAESFAKDKNEAWQIANHIFNAFSILLILLSVILFILAPWLIKILLPGFPEAIQKSALGLTRLLFLSPIFLGAANIFSGVLQYFHRFVAYGLAPIIYNFSIIFGILVLAPRYGIFGVGLGVILGAGLYFLSQFLAAIKCGFVWQPLVNFRHQAINKVFGLMIPRTVALLCQQMNLWVITIIASLIGSSALATFYFANNLQGFFVNLIGVSLGTAVFPLLSQAIAEKKYQEFSNYFKDAFKKILVLSWLATMFLMVAGKFIIGILLAGGRFDAVAAQNTLNLVLLFSFSLFAQAGNTLLIRAFFSFQEAKTPVLGALAALFINIVALIIFWQLNWGALGLAVSFSLAAIGQFFLIWILLKKKLKTGF